MCQLLARQKWRQVAPYSTRHPRNDTVAPSRVEKLPETLAACLKEVVDLRHARLMFEDEARFGRMVSKKEILAAIDKRYPLREVGREQGTAPSVDYEFVDGLGDIGVIASVTEPFCTSCTRVRLTADGKLVTCLFSETGHDLKSLLRSGATNEDLMQFISAVWRKRNDRYSDERLEALHSAQGYQSKDHKKIEMISLGG